MVRKRFYLEDCYLDNHLNWIFCLILGCLTENNQLHPHLFR